MVSTIFYFCQGGYVIIGICLFVSRIMIGGLGEVCTLLNAILVADEII